MLSQAKVVPFLATTDGARARAFYEGVLGLRVVSDDGFAIVVESGGSTLRIAKVQEKAKAPYTVLGWEVDDVRAAVAALAQRGVTFARYDFMEQDEAGIWTAPGGARVAWFQDPDGNVLSVSSHPPATAATAPSWACPRCSKPLDWMTSSRFGAYLCPKCHGMWVERSTWDAVVRVTEQTGGSDLPRPDARELGRNAPPVACLVCGAPCARILSWAGGVEVDLCPPHGLWFDRDELQTILDDVARSARHARTRLGLPGAELSGSSEARDVGIGESFVEVGRGGGEAGTAPSAVPDAPHGHHDHNG